MTQNASPSFAFCIESDAYTTAGKIMGRQAAGQGFLRGLGRTWPKGLLRGVATGGFDREDITRTLAASGFAGEMRLTRAPGFEGAVAVGALYYPTLPLPDIARFRNRIGPAAFSLFGVTHTICSDRALDGIACLASYPFMPWDALICTSHAAKQVVDAVIAETQDELRAQTGADRFSSIQTPVIPLGVHCETWAPAAEKRGGARRRLGLADDEVAFLFAGRLSFHAKANPAPLYQALQSISGDAKVVLIEAGLFPNEKVGDAYRQAQTALAPNVRFIHAPGDDPVAYSDAWRAADVFTSLSDNVQETFGLTPVEAMAAGLPVVGSDWNGYRSNIRDGVDGFLVPTIAAPPGAGVDLGIAVASGATSYDRQIGLLSLGVAVDGRTLREALHRLATDGDLRARMGANGQRRAQEAFDWPIVLHAYEALTQDLARIRRDGRERAPLPWLTRSDPFARFETFSTRTTRDDELVTLGECGEERLAQVENLDLANFAFHPVFLDPALPKRLVGALRQGGGRLPVEALLARAGGEAPAARRALAWLLKFGVVEIGCA